MRSRYPRAIERTGAPRRLPIAGGVLLAAALLVLVGCRPVEYYSQAVIGQIDILAGRQPLARLIASPATPETLKTRLQLVLEIRQFADTRLALPVGDTYLTYIDLGRPEAAYAVFAAPEFSLAPKTWCYPIAGCTAYRGYFSQESAHGYARYLEADGYDVYIGGIPAYSTLGWFEDPVLNTFVYWDPPELAALIFHELAHQILYLKDDTTFNESFAATVEKSGVQRWLDSVGRKADYPRYKDKRRRQKEYVALVTACRRRLETLYSRPMPETDMRKEKATVFLALETESRALRQKWGLSANDAGNLRPLNNAYITSVSAYHDLVPAFETLLSACNGDLPRFYDACKRLAQMPPEERKSYLSDPRALSTLALQAPRS